MDASILLLIGIVVLLLLLVITAAVVAVYSGLLHDIEVGAGKSPVSKITVAYKFARGPYKDCGALFTETCSLATNLRSIGVYYDDPAEVRAEKLRYLVGSIVAEGDEQPDAAVVKLFAENDFKLFTFPAVTNAVRTSFPYTTSFSIPIAVYRVYPAIANYITKHHLETGPWCEVYHDSVIDYMAPLDHQQDFYVPEALAAAADDAAAAAVTGPVEQDACSDNPADELQSCKQE